MKLRLERKPTVDGATLGSLYVDGLWVCHTLEDEIREIPGKPVAEWKVKNVTAIPAGTYEIELQNSPRFGLNTPTLLNVSGFSYIRMHSGLWHWHTEGCILLGLKVDRSSIVSGTTKPAVELVKALIKAAVARGERVTIQIINPPEVA